MNQQLVIETLPILDLDHPGAQDLEYRKRRLMIANAAIAFHHADPSSREIPVIQYTEEEQGVWRHIVQKITPLQEKWACSFYKEGRRQLQSISGQRLPVLREVSQEVEQKFSFRLEPVHGLVTAREFLMKLEHDVMLSTQYLRHPSLPEFTPEPDIVHEILGHVPMFTHATLREFSRMIGRAARLATEEQMIFLNRLYWFTVEFGLIEEDGQIKAFGAGLLGGIQDLRNACEGGAFIKPFDLPEVIHTDYNYSFNQPVFFVIPSLAVLIEETRKFLQAQQLMTN